MRLAVYAAVIGTLWAMPSGCSTTRRIPEGEILYNGLKKVEFADDSVRLPSELASSIKDAVNVPPNNYWKLLGWHYPFPLGLWVYNNWINPPSGLKHWLYEKLVAEPVLVSDVRPEVRTKMIDEILNNNGYFRGSASYELVTGRNPRKAKIRYAVNPGEPYPIKFVDFLPDTTALNHMIDSLARTDSYLNSTMRYSTDSLSVARTRITNSLRNRGYYFFRPEYIEYLADSIGHPRHVLMKMVLASNTPKMATRRYRTGKVTVVANRYRGGGTADTIETPRATLVQMMPSRLRHKLIPECVTFRPGRTFSVRDMNRTQTNLSRLGIFNSIDIIALPDTVSGRNDMLNVNIECTFDAPWEAAFEVNASSKSNSYLGPGMSFKVTNHNIFGGGEQLTLGLNGSYEWQTGRGRSSIFNSYEIGLTTSLAFPRLIAPKFIPRSRYQLNWTRFQLNADLLNRPHYFKMAQFNASVSYDWRVTRHVSATFTPIKLTYTNLMHTTEVFDSIMTANPAVAQSFMSQYIPQMMFSYVYDRQFDSDNTLNWQFSIQEAGNIFWAIYRACGKKGEKELFGTPFSQFVKGSTQLVYGRRVSGNSWIYGRAAVGAAHAYGNSSQVPYAEQFYCGGANSVRAFTVRSIGPGSYHDPATEDTYFDQTGTFKFEANIEYRFPIAGPLQGALFIDAGNVWLLKKDPRRPGGELKASSFLKDLALGTGTGLRFDIGMLVIRGDLGIGIHAPYDTGRSGYCNMRSFGKSLAFHLAIGYPF
ncbi:MAG: BamA/TamA family outer membrane protein [Muribaculaceae bacterium]|nr:BamA/TamA family outer membrane protein [Muribaculaceae bacterium]